MLRANPEQRELKPGSLWCKSLTALSAKQQFHQHALLFVFPVLFTQQMILHLLICSISSYSCLFFLKFDNFLSTEWWQQKPTDEREQWAETGQCIPSSPSRAVVVHRWTYELSMHHWVPDHLGEKPLEGNESSFSQESRSGLPASRTRPCRWPSCKHILAPQGWAQADQLPCRLEV